MKNPILIISQIEEIRSDIKINELPKSVPFGYNITVEGSGSFDNYIKNGIFDNQKLVTHILKGKIKLTGIDNI